MDNQNLYVFSSSLIGRLREVLDLTRNATTEEDFNNIEKFIGGNIIVEIEGSLRYFNTVKYGTQMTSVLMKMNGIKTVSDYSVRRKAVLDSIEIINKIKNSLTDELVIPDKES